MENERLSFEEEVKLIVEAKELNGILTHPAKEGPHPAIVLLHGSDRSGATDPYYKKHAENLVQSGFAVLRYNGPGWGGQPADVPGFETLEYRTEEAIAAVNYLRSRPDIRPNTIGLWGFSQGGWICQMAAAAYESVALIISISGSGVTPAEQEVFRVGAQSRAAGFEDNEIARAVLLRRLMVDIVLPEPAYQTSSQAEAMRLADGPWNEIMELVYSPNPTDPSLELAKVIEVMNAIKKERWAKFLELEQILPILESVPPEAWEIAKSQLSAIMNVNSANLLTKVHCPVLAIFGERDTCVPVQRSIVLYKRYLKEAGNENVTIKVFPNADHHMHVNGDFAPGYFETINNWLFNLNQ